MVGRSGGRVGGEGESGTRGLKVERRGQTGGSDQVRPHAVIIIHREWFGDGGVREESVYETTTRREEGDERGVSRKKQRKSRTGGLRVR